MPSKRVIIDTNLWISFLITKNYAALDNLLLSKKITLLFSDELLREFMEVVSRKKFSQIINPNHVQSLLTVITDYSIFIEVNSSINFCRDDKDNFLLALAKDGKADFLITGGKDLLDLKEFGNTKIVTIANFL